MARVPDDGEGIDNDDTRTLDPGDDEQLDVLGTTCPVCGEILDTQQGLKSHITQSHPHYDPDDTGTETGGDGDDDDGQVVLGEDVEFEPADDDEDLDEYAAKREQAHKTVDDLWDDAREAYRDASMQGHPTTRRDALGKSLEALDAETQWMSVRERSENGSQDLWVWTGERWDDAGDAYVAERMDKELGTDADRRTVRKAVHHLAVRNRVDASELNAGELDATLIPVRNGVINVDEITYDADAMTIDLSTVELRDRNPQHKFTYIIDTEWDPEAADLHGLDEWVSKIVASDDDMNTVWELAGHALHPRYPTDGFGVFVGEGGSGKSMLLKAIKLMLGDEDVTTLSISKIEQERFAIRHVADARANINTELNGTKIQSIDALKTLSAGEEVFAEAKGEQGYFTRNDATMIFASDNPPALPNRNNALKRRLYPVEFPCKFVTDPDPANPFELQYRSKIDVEEELHADDRIQAVLVRAVEGLVRLLHEGDFTTEMSGDERLQRYESFADPARHFALHCLEDAGPESVIESSVFQEVLDAFCAAQDHPGKSMRELTGVLDDMPELSYHKDRTRSWSDEQSMHTVYQGLRFSAEAIRHFVPEHAMEHLDLSAVHDADETDQVSALDYDDGDGGEYVDNDDDDEAADVGGVVDDVWGALQTHASRVGSDDSYVTLDGHWEDVAGVAGVSVEDLEDAVEHLQIEEGVMHDTGEGDYKLYNRGGA